MANISDIIEQFLLESLDFGESVNISRNELSKMFAVAPSQINYVLTTRFTADRGFLIESKRGGGGSITVVRLSVTPHNILNELKMISIADGLSYKRAEQILERLRIEGIISRGEEDLLKVAVSDKCLIAPTMNKDSLRASIIKNIALHLLREDREENYDL